MKPKSSLRAFLLGSTMLAAPLVQATNLYWDPSGTGSSDGAGVWLGTGRWWDGITNVNWADYTAPDAIFGTGGTGGAVTLASPTTVGSITFNTFTGTYTLGTSGQALTINSGITMNAGSGAVSIISPIILGGNQTWTNNSPSTLTTPNGTNFITNGGFDLTIDGTGTTNIGNVGSGNVTLSGSGDLIKNGTGRLNIGGVNSGFSGTVTINGGVMQVTNNNEPMGNGNVTLNDGVLSFYWSAVYTRSLGDGNNQVQVLGGESGFAGAGTSGPSINLGSTVRWGAAGEGAVDEFDLGATGFFNPSVFVLGDAGTTNAAATTFSSGIDLNGTSRTISVPKGLSAGGNTSTITGTLSNSAGTAAGYTKTGDGRLILSPTNGVPYTYDGPTKILGGTLKFGTGFSTTWNDESLPSTSNLELNGGVAEVFYPTTRTIGAGAGQMQITGGRSGFTHLQGDRSGNIFWDFGNSATTITWGSTSFNPSTLVLNDAGAAASIRMVNPFDLNGAERTIEVSATGGNQYGNYATMEGDLSGSGASLKKTGVGTLIINGTNSYDGGTTINGGALWFNKLVSMPASGTVTVNDGSILSVGVGNSGGWTTGTTGAGTIGGLLANTGGQGNTVTYVGNVTLGINVTGSEIYAGNIADKGTSLGLHIGNKDSGTLDLFAAVGTLELSGTNTFSGGINVNAGSTLILSGDSSGATGRVSLNNGYLEASKANVPGGVTFAPSGSDPAIWKTSGSLSADIGSSADVFWSSNGGFAATTSALTVTLNSGATLNWGSATGFNQKVLQLGSPTSTAMVELTNDITIENNRTIRLFGNTASGTADALISGDIVRNSSNRNLTIQGSGTLVLTGANDIGAGTFEIQTGAVVRAVDGVGLPTDAKLNFNGGVFESSGSFSRTIANTAGNVYWGNNGGFAANGGTLNVNLNGGATIDWNATTGFNAKTLIMGSGTANNVVTIANNIDLKNNRTITVNDNPDSLFDSAALSGIIANGDATARTLTKNGNGTLLLNGINSYTGLTTVSAGTFGGTGTIAGSVTVAAAANLAPGASAGTLSISGGLDISAPANSTGKLDYELDTLAASDKIAVTGALTIGVGKLGLGDFNFTNLGGLENGDYTLISSGGITGGNTLAGDTTGTLGSANIELKIIGNDIVLTVSGLGGGPGPLDHFAISAIGSPQTVGSPITGITLTAQDASNNTVTSFTGTVNFGGTGGFIGTSASFTAGVLNGVSVTPTVAGGGLTFTVTDIGSGKTGSATIATVQTQYDGWSSGAAFDADANGDGVNNGLAFLLGAANPSVSALDLLPAVTENSGNLVLSFTYLNADNRGSSVLSVLHSNDLGISDPWTSVTVPDANDGPTSGVTFIVTPGNPSNTVQATISASEAASGKLFGRLKAQQ